MCFLLTICLLEGLKVFWSERIPVEEPETLGAKSEAGACAACLFVGAARPQCTLGQTGTFHQALGAELVFLS